MPSAAWALQKAIHAALAADTSFMALLGNARIFDDVPRGAQFPYISFGLTTERDWSTATEPGSEHLVTLHVWSRARGRNEADELLEAVRVVLQDADLTLEGHHLVNLRHEFADVRRDSDGETFHGIARLRAVTEPTP